MAEESSGWIGVDLDGTLARFDGWKGHGHIGEPIAPMVDRVKAMLANGDEVRIFTARAFAGLGDPHAMAEISAPIDAWCERHLGTRLKITCIKDYEMALLYDDRAVQVEHNTGRPIGPAYWS